ncbi:hypothetical protein [Phocaeicola plebeius]|uniref:hypothetical protein n=1 Tax=Phocaeicola plebeius TaxID=310297 RepID=UPI003209D67B
MNSMKSYRKKRCLFYDFMKTSSILLGLAMVITSFIIGKLPIIAIPGFVCVLYVTLLFRRSLQYVILTDVSLIIRHQKNPKYETVVYFSEIDSVNLEYSSIDGCKLGIKRGYITKDYTLLLVGKKELDELKKDLEDYGIHVCKL